MKMYKYIRKHARVWKFWQLNYQYLVYIWYILSLDMFNNIQNLANRWAFNSITVFSIHS